MEQKPAPEEQAQASIKPGRCPGLNPTGIPGWRRCRVRGARAAPRRTGAGPGWTCGSASVYAKAGEQGQVSLCFQLNGLPGRWVRNGRGRCFPESAPGGTLTPEQREAEVALRPRHQGRTIVAAEPLVHRTSGDLSAERDAAIRQSKPAGGHEAYGTCGSRRAQCQTRAAAAGPPGWCFRAIPEPGRPKPSRTVQNSCVSQAAEAGSVARFLKPFGRGGDAWTRC